MQFLFQQVVQRNLKDLFEFHRNPENLLVLLPGRPRLRLLYCDGRVAVGRQTWLQIRLAAGVPLVLGFRHVLYEPPHRFGERLIHGPFSTFTHIHEFEATGAGTLCRDLFEVELPWCYGGEAAVRTLVAPRLRWLLALRGRNLQRTAREGLTGRMRTEDLAVQEES